MNKCCWQKCVTAAGASSKLSEKLLLGGFESHWIQIHRRWWEIGRVCSQLFVWSAAQFQFERAAVDDVGVADPDFWSRLTVQLDALDIFIFCRVVPANNGKRFAIMQMDGDAVKNWAGDVVNRHAGCDRIKSHHGEYDEGAHTAAIFVAGHA